MINAKELRIGNWVSQVGLVTPSIPVQVTHISQELDLSRVNPIPLTPEILEKCGFELVKQDHIEAIIYSLKDIMVIFEPNEDSSKIEEIGRVLVGAIETPFCSLHSLQNLYYFLTGEQLNYKP